MIGLTSLAAAVAPWNELYSRSTLVSSSVTFVHLGSLLIGGGFAVASDRMALRVRCADTDERRRVLRDFSSIHRPVVAGLALMALSGIGMALADVETFLVAPVFWLKMGLVVLLLTNGLVVTRTERALAANPSPSNRLWVRFTAGAVASLSLWLATTLVGVILTTA